jgi:hypothetical protein
MLHQSKQQLKNGRPNKKELIFLNLAYNKFYDLCKKLKKEKKTLSSEEKLIYLKNIFQIYNECLRYEPIGYFIKYLEKTRPPGEVVVLEYLKVIRHIFVHFPFFDKWDDMYITRDLIIWSDVNSNIDSFLLKNEGREKYEWRIWDGNKKEMKYGYVIKFPQNYSKNSKFYIKDSIDEDKGIEISLLMIKKVLESQVESIK